jgi:hypothetical protein
VDYDYAFPGGLAMNATLLAVGLVSLIAAIVGGGLKMLGNELPVLQSVRRQVMLGVVGVLLIGIAMRSEWVPAVDAGDDSSASRDVAGPSPEPTVAETAANLTPAQRAADIRTPEGSDFRNPTQEAQYRMIALGYDVGYPDGLEGQKTTASLVQFQREANLPVSGTADDATLRILRARSQKAFLVLVGEKGEGATDYLKRWLPALVE